MSGHNQGPGQQVAPRVYANSQCFESGSPAAEPEHTPAVTSISVPFQLVADFQVEAERAAEFLQEPDLDPQERSLFLAIITTPEALNRICRLAIVCDLTEDSRHYFEGKFMGPEPEDILDSIRPYLPVELEKYWTQLHREDCGCFDFCMDRIFQQFRSSLRKTEIIDLTTGESVPLWANSKIHIVP